jgi:hypothetical protein
VAIGNVDGVETLDADISYCPLSIDSFRTLFAGDGCGAFAKTGFGVVGRGGTGLDPREPKLVCDFDPSGC